MSGTDDLNGSRHDYAKPYTGSHGVPTVQQYRSQKAEEQAALNPASAPSESRTQHAIDATKSYWFPPSQDPKPASTQEEDSRQTASHDHDNVNDDARQNLQANNKTNANANGDQADQDGTDTTEITQKDPKTLRKELKNKGNQRSERTVTDPVTHLPISIRDFTEHDLEMIPRDDDPFPDQLKKSKSYHRSDSGLSKILHEQESQQQSHDATKDLFPPPSYDAIRDEFSLIYRKVITVGAILIIAILSLPAVFWAICTVFSMTLDMSPTAKAFFFLVMTSLALLGSAGVVFGLQDWAEKQVKDTWDESVWRADQLKNKERGHHGLQESVIWFNKLFGSLWPLINPDLFTSLADTLEDVMQASLPKLVRMVSVDDLGQGSEPFRILAIKTLPKGAAARSVSVNGALEDGGKDTKSGEEQEKKKQACGQLKEDSQPDNKNEDEKEDEKEDPTADSSGAGGMEAEEGEFVNLEVAFAYKSSKIQKRFRDRAKNAHLYLGFFLPGKIKLPVWVELRGLVGVMRVRLQLTPDPPFVGLATISFLGQPKVDMSCVPLIKVGPNIMDLPLISNFVQSSLDAAFSQYVAPKSLTLDLKAMLAGDDFKNDTLARGVVRVKIIRCFDFKAGDPGIPLITSGSSDPYISVGWAKFGKPVWSTRVLPNEMSPYWEEECFVLVGPEELDADENLRVQLWDSDRTSADDDLGRIELSLKAVMKNENSNGKMWHRVDAFEALKAGEAMPGRCEWEVGYFSKTRLFDYQIQNQKDYEGVKTLADLKKKVHDKAEKKLRETAKDETAEVEQQKQEDWEETQRNMIANSAPPDDYPSGILSIQIHQIVGLEIEEQNKQDHDDEGELEAGDDSLPSSYCTIIMNDMKMYKTRTKPKNNAPFFNASTERFVRDWHTTQLMVTVRDARVHEDDPLLGVVHLPIGKILKSRGTSHFNDYFPLAGGIGYGRMRVSVVFRSVQMQPPPEALGWEWGTLEINRGVTAIGDLPKELRTHRLKFRTNVTRGRMHTSRHHSSPSSAADDADAEWNPSKDRALLLPVRKRYSSALIIEFRSNSSLLRKDKTPAFAVLWLSAIPDESNTTLTLPIYTGNLARAAANVLPASEMGTQIGSLRLTLRFWRGVGAGHRSLAAGNPDIANVLEALGTIRDNGELPPLVGDAHWRREKARAERDGDAVELSDGEDGLDHDESGSDSSDDDDQDDEKKDVAGEESIEPSIETSDDDVRVMGTGSLDAPGSSQKEQLHRRHRGIMQWKTARTAKWMKHKAEGAADKVRGSFEHRERTPGVETEA